ncbi:MAG: hypothetical protein KHX02_05200 [Collinsella stercoris]|nr:hypothetical protein [Collinsella stercoris]
MHGTTARPKREAGHLPDMVHQRGFEIGPIEDIVNLIAKDERIANK